MRNSNNSKWSVLLYNTKLERFYHADNQQLCAVDQAWETSEYFGGCAGLRAWAPLPPMATHSAVPRETGNPDFHVKLPCLENTEMGQAKFLCAGFNPWTVGRRLPGEGLAQLILRYNRVQTAEDRLSCQNLRFLGACCFSFGLGTSEKTISIPQLYAKQWNRARLTFSAAWLEGVYLVFTNY